MLIGKLESINLLSTDPTIYRESVEQAKLWTITNNAVHPSLTELLGNFSEIKDEETYKRAHALFTELHSTIKNVYEKKFPLGSSPIAQNARVDGLLYKGGIKVKMCVKLRGT